MGEFQSPRTKKRLALITGLSFGSPKELTDAIDKQVDPIIKEEPLPITSIMSAFTKKVQI